MTRHPNLSTKFQHWTRRAFRGDAGADVFSEGDEEFVDFDPVLGREHGFEGEHGLFGGFGVDVAPAVADSVDVDVNADSLLAAGDADDMDAMRPSAPPSLPPFASAHISRSMASRVSASGSVTSENWS